jgi:hypothetical protein
MRRRSFLASLAAFFGFGAAAEAKGREPSWRWNDIAAAADADAGGYDGVLVIPKGTPFNCTSGHIACEAIETIRYGDAKWPDKLGHWRYPMPDVSDDQPLCPCGAVVVFWRSDRGYNR